MRWEAFSVLCPTCGVSQDATWGVYFKVRGLLRVGKQGRAQ